MTADKRPSLDSIIEESGIDRRPIDGGNVVGAIIALFVMGCIAVYLISV